MSDLRTELDAKWRDALTAERGGHEWRGVALRVAAPVRFIAAVREPDERVALLIEAPLDAAFGSAYRVHAAGLSVTDQRRQEEGLFRLAITLESDGLRDVFEVLAADIVAVAASATEAREAIVEAVGRLEAWRACLAARRQGLSSGGTTGAVRWTDRAPDHGRGNRLRESRRKVGRAPLAASTTSAVWVWQSKSRR